MPNDKVGVPRAPVKVTTKSVPRIPRPASLIFTSPSLTPSKRQRSNSGGTTSPLQSPAHHRKGTTPHQLFQETQGDMLASKVMNQTVAVETGLPPVVQEAGSTVALNLKEIPPDLALASGGQ